MSAATSAVSAKRKCSSLGCSSYGSLHFLPASLLVLCLPWVQWTGCTGRYSKTTGVTNRISNIHSESEFLARYGGSVSSHPPWFSPSSDSWSKLQPPDGNINLSATHQTGSFMPPGLGKCHSFCLGRPLIIFRLKKKVALFFFVNFCLALSRQTPVLSPSHSHGTPYINTSNISLVVLYCNCWFTRLSSYETISSLRKGTVCLLFVSMVSTTVLNIFIRYLFNKWCVNCAFEMHKKYFSFSLKGLDPSTEAQVLGSFP